MVVGALCFTFACQLFPGHLPDFLRALPCTRLIMVVGALCFTLACQLFPGHLPDFLDWLGNALPLAGIVLFRCAAWWALTVRSSGSCPAPHPGAFTHWIKFRSGRAVRCLGVWSDD